jgi:hypothetical protein
LKGAEEFRPEWYEIFNGVKNYHLGLTEIFNLTLAWSPLSNDSFHAFTLAYHSILLKNVTAPKENNTQNTLKSAMIKVKALIKRVRKWKFSC